MSFTQQAYTNPQTMLVELQAYFDRLGKNNGWSEDFRIDVRNLVQQAYDDNYSFFSFDETIVQDMVKQVIFEFEQTAILEGKGNPEVIPRFQKVMNTLYNLSDTAFVVDQYSGVSGITNVAQDQLEEQSKKLEETRDKTFNRLVPILGIGLVAYFVLPRLAETYLEKK